MGMTLDGLSKRSGLTPNYIGGVEMGLRDPSLSTCCKLAKGFAVPVAELLGGQHGLSPAALEFSRMLISATPDVWDALEKILKSSPIRRR